MTYCHEELTKGFDDEQDSFNSLLDFFSEPFHFPSEIGDGCSNMAPNFRSDEDDAFFSYLGFEEPNQFAHSAGTQFIDPETATLSILGGRAEEKRRREVWAKHLNEACDSLDGTFDENQLVFFRELFSRFYGIFAAKDENAPSIKDSIEYFFSANSTQNYPVSFEELLSCFGTNIRPDYLRLRLIYKLWEGGWKMPKLPFFYSPIPMFVQNRLTAIFNRNKDTAFYEGWTLGDAELLSELLWQNIGIPRTKLTALFLSLDDSLNEQKVEQMIDFLISERLVSQQTKKRERLTNLQRKIIGRAEEVEKDIPTTLLSEPRLYLIGENPQQLVTDIWENEHRIISTTFMNVFAFVS